ncbi:AfsR/SARP family transcriptional regulator [Amycolatopsis magusensis]|uniref:AfsR/SARP family transcriptional regulator n=1 Tax=Amycolatopsis magusensis TaxID=882444 RepID=UPI003C2E49D2
MFDDRGRRHGSWPPVGEVVFRLSGRIGIVRGVETRPVGSASVQGLLAALLLERGQYVAKDRLVEALWDEPPRSAMENLRGYVWRLRRVLAEIRPAAERSLTTVAGNRGGYALTAPPEQVDVLRFADLAEQASVHLRAGKIDQARAGFSGALALWNGPVGQGGAASRALQARFHALDRLQLTVRERLVHVKLLQGHSAEVIPELQSLVGAAPHRETSWALLMRACYLAGDLAGAMSTWRLATRSLADEFGLDPSDRFRELHGRILHRDEDGVRYSVLPA